jgi:hypothetical protein
MERTPLKKPLPLVRLIHQHPADAARRVDLLASLGFRVQYEPLASTPLFRSIDTAPPSAIVIDLDRLPSHGLHYGHALRRRKTTRFIPLVFAGGLPEKIEKVRALLPDAVYCDWDSAARAIAQAIRSAPAQPVVPPEMPISKPGRALVDKLGVKPGMAVILIDAPRHAESLLEPLPKGAEILTPPAKGDLFIWFARDPAEFQNSVAAILRKAAPSPVWIAWPKQASSQFTGLTQNMIRQSVIDLGGVDYKICSIDETWSGLLFRQRKAE